MENKYPRFRRKSVLFWPACYGIQSIEMQSEQFVTIKSKKYVTGHMYCKISFQKMMCFKLSGQDVSWGHYIVRPITLQGRALCNGATTARLCFLPRIPQTTSTTRKDLVCAKPIFAHLLQTTKIQVCHKKLTRRKQTIVVIRVEVRAWRDDRVENKRQSVAGRKQERVETRRPFRGRLG